MPIAIALSFLFLPYLFHVIVTGTFISGLWIYFFGCIIASIFIFQETQS